MESEVLRMKQLTQMVNLKRSTIYKLLENNNFPRPIKLTDKAVAWKKSDIIDWINSRDKK